MAKYGVKARKTISKEMHKFGKRELKIGTKGGKVKSRKQAIAVGISEARRKGEKVPPRRKRQVTFSGRG